MSNGEFEIYKDTDNQYWFRLKAGNGENIGKSEGYTRKLSAEEGIVSVQKNSDDRDNFKVYQSSKDDKWYFNLHSADNGQVILTCSQGYSSKQGLETGIASVMENGSTETIDDLT